MEQQEVLPYNGMRFKFPSPLTSKDYEILMVEVWDSKNYNGIGGWKVVSVASNVGNPQMGMCKTKRRNHIWYIFFGKPILLVPGKPTIRVTIKCPGGGKSPGVNNLKTFNKEFIWFRRLFPDVEILDYLTKGGGEVELRIKVWSYGSEIGYSWAQTSGPTVALNRSNTSNPSFNAPNLVEPSVLGFKVACSGEDFDDFVVDVNVTVNVDKDTPDVSIQYSPFVDSGEICLCSATVFNHNKEEFLRFHWRQISGPEAAMDRRGQPQMVFVAPTVSKNTKLGFCLEVFDGEIIGKHIFHVQVNG